MINGSIDFRGTTLQKGVDLSDTEIMGSSYFSGVQFNQSANFSFSRFNQFAEFRFSRFNKFADFSYSQFDQESYFEDAHFLNATFDYSQFSKEAFFDGAEIDKLSLYRTKYDKLNIRWSNITDLDYDDTAYYLLIENFKKQGLTDDANDCYYSYRCKHGWELLCQGIKNLNLSWLFDSLAWWSYGYGLRPERPLGWSVFFIIAAGMFFWRSKSIKRKEGDSKVSIWEAFLLSSTYFTSGASAIISSTSEEFKPTGKSRYVIVFLRLVGWIFFVFFLSSLGRTV